MAVQFQDVLNEMHDVYKKKNQDYGNSFGETIQEFGFIPAVARINDKVKRLKNIVKGQRMMIKDETMRDCLLDIANYCVLTIMENDNIVCAEEGENGINVNWHLLNN